MPQLCASSWPQVTQVQTLLFQDDNMSQATKQGKRCDSITMTTCVVSWESSEPYWALAGASGKVQG